MKDPVHLYLIADAPTCFSHGKGQFVLICDRCFADVEKWLQENNWSSMKDIQVNAPCIRCERDRYPEESANLENNQYPAFPTNSLLFE